MTATLEAPARPGDPSDVPSAPRRVPPQLVPWHDPHPAAGWIATLVITVLAGFTRFWALGLPPTKNFDEAYYPVEAQELLRFGYEDNRGYMFIVHPPLGKWLIAFSEYLWDGSSGEWLTNSVGWRIAPALAGVAGVVMMTRIVRRMMRSNLFGFIGGLLMALDGMSLVLARTAILDIFLQLFVIAAFGAMVVDRDMMRARLAGLIADGADLTDGSPTLGPRPWRLVAGVMWGLACAVKWTALSFFLFFVVLSFVWDRAALKSAGVRRPTRNCGRRAVLPGLGSLVVAPVVTYLTCYLGWFTGENSWNRHWADTHGSSAHLKIWGLTNWFHVKIPFNWGWVPGPIRSLGDYTYEAYRFHEGLDSGHAYASNPWSWLVLGRPVDFYYDSSSTACGSSSCSREVLLIGTPLMWWAFVPMLLWLAWHWISSRDWRAAAVWVAFAAGWLVWFQDLKRTMFLFYMAPLVPFLIIGVTLALGVMVGAGGERLRRQVPHSRHGESVPPGVVRPVTVFAGVALIALSLGFQGSGAAQDVVIGLLTAVVVVAVGWELYERWQACPPGGGRRFWGTLGVSVYLGLVVADFAWMWPIFTGGLLTYNEWHAHMWLPSWV